MLNNILFGNVHVIELVSSPYISLLDAVSNGYKHISIKLPMVFYEKQVVEGISAEPFNRAFELLEKNY